MPVVETQQGTAIIGGFTDPDQPLAFISDIAGNTTEITFTPNPAKVQIHSVAIDASGVNGVLGGFDPTSATSRHVYVVDVSSATATQVSGLLDSDDFFSVAISETGLKGLSGGVNLNTPIAYTLDILAKEASPITIAEHFGTVRSVSINTNGDLGVIGGGAGGGLENLFAYKVNTATPSTPIRISLPSIKGEILGTAIDATGSRILLGGTITEPTISGVAYIDIQGTTANITFPDSVDEITSVAINRAGTVGILGGFHLSAPRAYTLNLSPTVVTPITLDTAAPFPVGKIHSVAIDSNGAAGLLGGEKTIGTTLYPIAYTVNVATGVATEISLPLKEGAIKSVEIQDEGLAGILGGELGTSDNKLPAAFLVTGILEGSPVATQLVLQGASSPGSILSVSFDQIVAQMSKIPTRGLSGNNLTLAEYINKNAPQYAFNFLPSTHAGKLNPALESASPARNAATLFSSDNALFSIAQGVSRRARDARQMRRFEEKEQKELALLATKDDPFCSVTNCPCEIRLNNLWGEVMGLVAHQDRQRETPGFDPWSIGGLLAYDAQKTKNFRGGIGLAYAYTCIDFDKGNGHSNVNQEYLSLYGLWNRHNLYGNLALWFGLFQTDNERKMNLTDFHFRATSFTSGYQFDPHVEVGYDYDFNHDTGTFEPYVSVDWIHNWQAAFKEYSSSAFKYFQERQHSSMLRAEFGFRVYEEFEFNRWNLVLQQNISYLYKDTYSLGNVKGFLSGAPGTLVLDTLSDSEHFGSVSFSMLFDPKRPIYPTGRVGYKGEFGSSYRSHQMTLTTEWSF